MRETTSVGSRSFNILRYPRPPPASSASTVTSGHQSRRLSISPDAQQAWWIPSRMSFSLAFFDNDVHCLSKSSCASALTAVSARSCWTSQTASRIRSIL